MKLDHVGRHWKIHKAALVAGRLIAYQPFSRRGFFIFPTHKN